MGKIIFWLVVIFAVLLVLRLVNVAKAKTRAGKPKAPPPAPMVRCVECGIYLPKSDARPVSEGFHCGQVNCSQQRPRNP